jgi:hypothetical protein
MSDEKNKCCDKKEGPVESADKPKKPLKSINGELTDKLMEIMSNLK